MKLVATLYTYANSRPSNLQIDKELIKERPCMYLTATKALAKERMKIIPSWQTDELSGKKIALFADAIRLLLKQNNIRVASRTEERTLFYRSLEEAFAHNSSLKELFRNDAKSWLNVLRDMATKGIDLVSNPLPSNMSSILVHQDLEFHLRVLHKKFVEQLKDNGLEFFESGVNAFLTTQFEPKDIIIMEGFTFLTEMQRLFVQACIDKGAEVKFLTAYNPSQPKGFEIIDRTYQGIPRQVLLTPSISSREDLNHLQSHLFSNTCTPFLNDVDHVKMTAYPNRDREMLACIQQLQTWFQDKTYKPSEVVIVMRHSKEFIDRLRDQLALNPLTYPLEIDGEIVQKNVNLFIPPRLLLLTPVGRFVLSLYQIWKQGTFQMPMNEFESILASGWLGPRIQDSASLFRALKHQYFSQCSTVEEWQKALDLLRTNHTVAYERLPQRLLQGSVAIIRKWSETIELLNGVCERLFSSGQQSIAQHVQLLQQELMKLIPRKIRDSEQQVLEQIQSVFTELSGYYTIEMSTSEFGEALHAITRGERDNEENEDEEENGEGEDEDLTLRVVTPETIDGLAKKVVIYVSVDSIHVPSLYAEQWPFYEDKRKEHLEKERYMFLTVVRSAEEELLLTYAKKDGDRSFQPSAYLGEMERVLDVRMDSKSILDQIDESLAKQPPTFPEAPVTKYREYRLDDLVHYALCPMRYRLELLHPEARAYRTEWQIEIVAQGIWLDQTYAFLAQQDNWPRVNNKMPDSQKIEQLYQYLLWGKTQVEPVIRQMFPTFSLSGWHAIEQRVNNQLSYHANKRGTYQVNIKQGHQEEEIEVFLSDQSNIIVKFNVPYYLESGILTIPLLDGDLCHEWLMPGELPDEDEVEKNGVYEEVEGVSVFADLYQAVTWWRRTIQSSVLENFRYKKNNYTDGLLAHKELIEEKLRHWIESIQDNRFPKHIGDHCRKCPVRMECLGIEEEE